MSTAGRTRIEKVQFYEDHIAPFTTNASTLGLSSGTITSLTAKTSAAREAYNVQQAALTASKAATEAFYNSVNALNIVGEDALSTIRGTAKKTGNPDIYTLAQIPGPVTPQPKGAPGTPTNLKVALGNTGALELKWKNSNGIGCVYAIYRSADGGPLVNLGGVGGKKFTDTTVPTGTSTIQYRIQAIRSTGTSDWGIFTVNLGGGSTGMLVTEHQPLKVAA